MAGGGGSAPARLLDRHPHARLRASRYRPRRQRDAPGGQHGDPGAGRRARHRQAAGPAFEPYRGGVFVKARTQEDITETSQTVAAGQLRAFIERLERVGAERDDLGRDLADIYAEAKGNGFDTKAMRTIVKLRKKDQAERQEEETILDLYKAALGMV
ncbi:MAG: DUF2312 domain-containing protein [Mesorhizobium sp.]|nr:MAG: DUF2312 domain-containing protein [Mesorhizobium sp.]